MKALMTKTAQTTAMPRSYLANATVIELIHFHINRDRDRPPLNQSPVIHPLTRPSSGRGLSASEKQEW